ncbi:MAG: MATE family efflux transporter [Erysipelotrichaceae bacterium]|nr:MATE family efflux transporter [Erysipelotrichaceae bacterium]
MNKKPMDMVNGPLLKNIFIFAIPLMATNLLQMLYNAADIIVVGKFAGQQALAAVGATSSLIFFFTSLFNGLATGTNVAIARAIGSQNKDNIHKGVNTSIILAVLSGITLTLLGTSLAKLFLTWMSTPADIIQLSTLYMRIYFMGSLFMIVYNFGAAILRANGETQKPLYFLMISGAINVVLNLIFVIFFHMSVMGVALATVISQAVSCILVLYTLINRDDDLRINLKEQKFIPEVALDIIRIGLPASFQGIAFAFSNIIIQSSINSFNSSIYVAGNSAANNLENFVYIGMMAFGQATITFTSQNVGAGKKENISRIMKTTLLLGTLSGFIVSFIVWYFGDFFLSLYTNDLAVIQAGKVRLFWVTLFLCLNGVMDTFINSMRGMGTSGLPSFLMVITICGVRFLWLGTIFQWNPQFEVIYMCFPISWIATSIIEYILYRKVLAQKLKEQI